MKKGDIIVEKIEEIERFEKEENYEESEEILKELGKMLGYNFRMNDDGNWIFERGSLSVEVMYDSMRGGEEVLLWFEKEGKNVEKIFKNIKKVVSIIECCIEYVCEEMFEGILDRMDKEGK